jgi:Domain of unknown function(DUF2779)
MPKPKYLTKSRFKVALECPTKLFYTAKKAYANQRVDDPFLLALADGGFQVGELAKMYHPDGIDIKEVDYETALAKTNTALQQDDVTIFEAAVRVDDLFIRVDVLKKRGNQICLFEVKSKAWSPGDDSMEGKRVPILAGWRPYVEDIAFQNYVVRKAFPGCSVSAFLTLVNKNVACPTDGLHQKFRVKEDENGRKGVESTPLNKEEMATKILVDVPVDSLCESIYAEVEGGVYSDYEAKVEHLAQAYTLDEKIPAEVTSACGSCEFRATDEDLELGLLCGRSTCWSEALGLSAEEARKPSVLDVSNFRKKDEMIRAGTFLMTDLSQSDLNPTTDGKSGLSPSERQWKQVEKDQNDDPTAWVDRDALLRVFSSWTFPLHFIDFETAAPAIPFSHGRFAYEGIAFQFSHHMVHASGRVEHAGEYLDVEPGKFPNYDFLRALRIDLEGDQGTIFRYAAHENTYLNLIYRQLMDDPADIADRAELCTFVRSITHSGSDSVERWEGDRNMVDMLELVKRFYYDPRTRGSNSLKYVLPAILNRSKVLQDRYSRPVYGREGGIVSLNFTDQTWVNVEDGTASNPYDMLPKISEGLEAGSLDFLSGDDALKDGGAAMTAYAWLQYAEMKAEERDAIRRALLKYCELDTLAMVILYEGLKDLCEVGA